VERAQVYLMAPEQPVELQTMGVKGAAILALEHKVELARSAGIKRLIQHMNHAPTEEIKVGSLKALLNLSLSLKNQQRICRRALPALLRHNNDPNSSREVRTYTSGLLHNLSKNPANTTDFYKVLSIAPVRLVPVNKRFGLVLFPIRERSSTSSPGTLVTPGTGVGRRRSCGCAWGRTPPRCLPRTRPAPTSTRPPAGR